jgi:glyoxylate reductase
MKVQHVGRDAGGGLDALLRSADVLSLHCPLTAETHHLIDEAALKKMKPSALLINTARGKVVDEDALVRALDQGWIRGAGLDVFEDEPAVHPGLIASKAAVLMPHVGSATWATRRKMAEMVTTDLLRVLDGHPPLHPVC